MIEDLINVTIKSKLNDPSPLISTSKLLINEKLYLSNINSKLINDESGHYINLKSSKKARNYTLQGIKYAEDCEYVSAIECYNESLQLYALSADTLCCRGSAYANINQLDNAINDYELALSIEPNHSNCLLYLNKIKDKIKEKFEQSQKESVKKNKYYNHDTDYTDEKDSNKDVTNDLIKRRKK